MKIDDFGKMPAVRSNAGAASLLVAPRAATRPIVSILALGRVLKVLGYGPEVV